MRFGYEKHFHKYYRQEGVKYEGNMLCGIPPKRRTLRVKKLIFPTDQNTEQNYFM